MWSYCLPTIFCDDFFIRDRATKHALYLDFLLLTITELSSFFLCQTYQFLFLTPLSELKTESRFRRKLFRGEFLTGYHLSRAKC